MITLNFSSDLSSEFSAPNTSYFGAISIFHALDNLFPVHIPVVSFLDYYVNKEYYFTKVIIRS